MFADFEPAHHGPAAKRDKMSAVVCIGHSYGSCVRWKSDCVKQQSNRKTCGSPPSSPIKAESWENCAELFGIWEAETVSSFDA